VSDIGLLDNDNRVKLSKLNDDPLSSYINASFIEVCTSNIVHQPEFVGITITRGSFTILFDRFFKINCVTYCNTPKP